MTEEEIKEQLERLEKENKESEKRFFEALKTVEKIKSNHDNWGVSKFFRYETGTLVKVKPCDDKYNNKTYLGILIGLVPLGVNYYVRDKTLIAYPRTNPAIFIPELKEVVYGCGSWWGKIESEEDFKNITSEDIENTWYVKLLKEQFSEST